MLLMVRPGCCLFCLPGLAMARRLWLCRVASVQTLGFEALSLAVWLGPGVPALLGWTFVLQVGCRIVGGVAA